MSCNGEHVSLFFLCPFMLESMSLPHMSGCPLGWQFQVVSLNNLLPAPPPPRTCIFRFQCMPPSPARALADLPATAYTTETAAHHLHLPVLGRVQENGGSMGFVTRRTRSPRLAPRKRPQFLPQTSTTFHLEDRTTPSTFVLGKSLVDRKMECFLCEFRLGLSTLAPWRVHTPVVQDLSSRVRGRRFVVQYYFLCTHSPWALFSRIWLAFSFFPLPVGRQRAWSAPSPVFACEVSSHCFVERSQGCFGGR